MQETAAAMVEAVVDRVEIATGLENSSRRVRKATVLHRAKVVVAARAWDNPQVLPMNPVRPVRRQVNPTRCAPASI